MGKYLQKIVMLCFAVTFVSPIAFAFKDHVPAPPPGGTGAVPVLVPLYNRKREHIGYISIIYIFENGFLKGVKKNQIALTDEQPASPVLPAGGKPTAPSTDVKKK